MLNGKLHHVGIIVSDAEQVKVLADLFGLQMGRRQYVAEYEAECFFTEGVLGVIEFIVPTGGKLAAFNKGMGGLHHIAIEVDDLDGLAADLGARDIRLLESSPVDAGPILINFLSPVYTRGVIVEYIQSKHVAGPEN